MDAVFGRKAELALLDTVHGSRKAEFVALYGRRRVGKTYLVRHALQHRAAVYLEFTGQKDMGLRPQLKAFQEALEKTFYAGVPIPALESWNVAFKTLAAALRAVALNAGGQRLVVFLDELPWMATPRSRLVQALDHAWNTELSKIPTLILIACGSAASWIIDNLIHAKGGLHNRLTRQIRLMPFTLPETMSFLKAQGMRFGLRAATQLYMAIGGIPYYLQQLDKSLSADQNIAQLCFSANGILRGEFAVLFRALFGDSDLYEKIVRILARNRGGLSRDKLLLQLKTGSGGNLNRKLKELEESGFIAKVTPYTNKKKHATYRIIDPYVYFYLKWIELAPAGVFAADGARYWLERSRTPAYEAWAGYAFENICLTHFMLIRSALGLDAIACEVGSWSYSPPRGNRHARGAQIDLLFDRSDGVISLCEIKYSAAPFSVSKAYAQELDARLDVFRRVTQTRKDLQWVLIAFNGFKPGLWSQDLVAVSITAEQIFGSAR